jgi:hypothetical protein
VCASEKTGEEELFEDLDRPGDCKADYLKPLADVLVDFILWDLNTTET